MQKQDKKNSEKKGLIILVAYIFLGFMKYYIPTSIFTAYIFGILWLFIGLPIFCILLIPPVNFVANLFKGRVSLIMIFLSLFTIPLMYFLGIGYLYHNARSVIVGVETEQVNFLKVDYHDGYFRSSPSWNELVYLNEQGSEEKVKISRKLLDEVRQYVGYKEYEFEIDIFANTVVGIRE